MVTVENEGLGRSGAKLYAGVAKTLFTATSLTQACYIKAASDDAKTAMRKLETILNDA